MKCTLATPALITTLASIPLLAIVFPSSDALAQTSRAAIIVESETSTSAALRAAVSEYLLTKDYAVAPTTQLEAARIFVLDDLDDPAARLNQQQAESLWHRVGSDIGVFVEYRDVESGKLAISVTFLGIGDRPKSAVGVGQPSTLQQDVNGILSTIELEASAPRPQQPPPAPSPERVDLAGTPRRPFLNPTPPPGFIFDVAFAAGFAGQSEVKFGDVTVARDDLDPTLGAQLRSLTAAGDYFAIGLVARLARYAPTNPAREYETSLSLALAPTGRYRFNELLEAYVTVPIGVALGFFGSDLGEGADTGVGPSVGAFAGLRTYVTDDLSIFGELGLNWVSLNSSRNDVDFTVNSDPQFAISVGFGFN